MKLKKRGRLNDCWVLWLAWSVVSVRSLWPVSVRFETFLSTFIFWCALIYFYLLLWYVSHLLFDVDFICLYLFSVCF